MANIAKGQCLADVAVLGKGNIDAAIDLALDQDKSITAEQGGVDIIGNPYDAPAVSELAYRKAAPATAAGEIAEGIGVWRVGLDFKVS